MKNRKATALGFGTIVAVLAFACAGASGDEGAQGSAVQAASDKLNTLEFTNSNGTLRTYTDNAKVMFKKNKIKDIAFFTSFGTNGRTCLHCHTPGDAWGVSAASVKYRFTHPLDATNADCIVNLANCPLDPDPTHYGSDPIFRLVDGANAPNLNVSTADSRLAAYSMLLTKGLIRVGMPIPANAEFDLVAVDDPYNYASANELSLYRRPLPSTNLRLSPTKSNANPTPVLNTVMWDGRETLPDHDVIFDLLDQAAGATLGHAQAAAGLSATDRQAIVDFETGLHTAQSSDLNAGDLAANGGNGGPEWLASSQPYYLGINDVLSGDSLTKAPFDPNVFTIYSAWNGSANAARAQIARGEALFDTKPIAIRGVDGLNDVLGIDTIAGTCTTCHDAPNYGHHSMRLPINIGLVGVAYRTPDLPLYTLQKKGTTDLKLVTDPGRALVTGKWADIGKMKGPILRGLAGRAPYFHNGVAATLLDAVTFYDTRFTIGFTDQEKADLAAFLGTL